MKAATKTKSGDKSQNGQLIKVTLNKALSAEAEWDDKVSYTVVVFSLNVCQPETLKLKVKIYLYPCILA